METRFTDIHGIRPSLPVWASFYHAGTDWLNVYEFHKQHRDNGIPSFMVIDPFIAGLTLELFVKSMAAYHDPTFNPRDYRHQTSKILENYKDKSEIFTEIVNDTELMELIREYQKTVSSRYGTIGGMIPYAEQEKIIATGFQIRQEISKLTKLS